MVIFQVLYLTRWGYVYYNLLLKVTFLHVLKWKSMPWCKAVWFFPGKHIRGHLQKWMKKACENFMKIFFTVSIKYIFQLYISHECLEVAYYVWWQCSGVYCLTINTYCLVRKNAYVLSSFNTWLKWNRYIDLIEPNFLLLWGFFFLSILCLFF